MNRYYILVFLFLGLSMVYQSADSLKTTAQYETIYNRWGKHFKGMTKTTNKWQKEQFNSCEKSQGVGSMFAGAQTKLKLNADYYWRTKATTDNTMSNTYSANPADASRLYQKDFKSKMEDYIYTLDTNVKSATDKGQKQGIVIVESLAKDGLAGFKEDWYGDEAKTAETQTAYAVDADFGIVKTALKGFEGDNQDKELTYFKGSDDCELWDASEQAWPKIDDFKTCADAKTQANVYMGIYQDLISDCAGYKERNQEAPTSGTAVTSSDAYNKLVKPPVVRDVIPHMADYIWKIKKKIDAMPGCTWFSCSTNGGCMDTTEVDTDSKADECVNLEPNAFLKEEDGPLADTAFATAMASLSQLTYASDKCGTGLAGTSPPDIATGKSCCNEIVRRFYRAYIFTLSLYHDCSKAEYQSITEYMEALLNQYETQSGLCYGIFSRHAEAARATFPSLQKEEGWWDSYDNTEQKFMMGTAAVGGVSATVGTVGFIKVHLMSSAVKPV